jgi:hypothetical protein
MLRFEPSMLRFEAFMLCFEAFMLCFEAFMLCFEAFMLCFEAFMLCFEAFMLRFEAFMLRFEAFMLCFEAFMLCFEAFMLRFEASMLRFEPSSFVCKPWRALGRSSPLLEVSWHQKMPFHLRRWFHPFLKGVGTQKIVSIQPRRSVFVIYVILSRRSCVGEAGAAEDGRRTPSLVTRKGGGI